MTLKRIPVILSCLCLMALAGLLVLAQAPPTAEETKEANLKTYVDLLRKDLKRDKVAILTELMELSPEEAAKFWPVYNEYDKALTKLGDERIAFVRMYAENYGLLTDQKVTQIATGLLDLEGRRNQLEKQYFQRMSQAMSPKLAARFLQIEDQIEKIIDLQIASILPVVE